MHKEGASAMSTTTDAQRSWTIDLDGDGQETYTEMSRAEAVAAYLETAALDHDEATYWVRLRVWPTSDPGAAVTERHAVHPDEPDCAEGQEHEWRDHGRDKVHGAGMIFHARCRYCGAVRITDTYAQDPADGEQGLVRVSYDLGDHDTSGPAGPDDKPSGCDVDLDDAIAQYVATYENDGPLGEGAVTVFVVVSTEGEGWRQRWYVHAIDADRVADEADDTAYETEAAAITAGEELAAARDQGNGDEGGEDYIARKMAEQAGEPDPAGEWCVWWSTVGDDSHCVERYPTFEAASAAAALANEQLHDTHPGGHLLCGHEVRCLVDGDWVSTDDDGGAA